MLPFYWRREVTLHELHMRTYKKTFQTNKQTKKEPQEKEKERGWAKCIFYTETFLNSTTYYFGPVYTREKHHAKKVRTDMS